MYYKDGLKIVSITEEPLKIYGLAVKEETQRQFYRLPLYMMEQMQQYDFLGKRSIGGRVRFATNSGKIYIKMTMDACREDVNVPLSCSAGADIYTGSGKNSLFLGYISPDKHTENEITVEKTFTKKEELETITINFPRNDLLLGMEIGVEENAILKEAPEYTIDKPIVYYGSSITEGGCACRVGNTYASIVSRWLDADYCNYGFSGSAKGESEFAQYIASLPELSLFVYDYDHNAPDLEHLKNTHESFFQVIRKAKPQLPIVILSRPDTNENSEDTKARRDIIYKTWQNASQAGDKNVWFLDGGTFFGIVGRMECTVDGVHPNALGFMRMAEAIYPLLEKILYGEEVNV